VVPVTPIADTGPTDPAFILLPDFIAFFNLDDPGPDQFTDKNVVKIRKHESWDFKFPT
jgi:hypothetical protein